MVIAMVFEFITSMAIFTTFTVLAVKTRQVLPALAVPMYAMISAGIIVHSTHFIGVQWSANLIRGLFLVLLFIGSLVCIDRKNDEKHGEWWRQVLAVGLPSLGLLIMVVASRAGATFQLKGILTSVQYLTPEDNAKWTNVASIIVQKNALGISDVGGILTTFLVIAESFVSAVLPIFGMNHNEINLTISTVVCGQLSLIVLAPFSLLPLTKLLNLDRNSWNAVPGFWLASFIVAGGSAAFQSLGHMSGQLVLVMGVYSVCTFLALDSSKKNHELAFYLCLFCVTTTASIWLPIQLLSALIPVAALGIFSYHRITRRDSKEIDLIILFPLALMVCAIPIAIDSFRYLTITNENFQNLLLAGGATQVVGPLMGLLPFVLFSFVFFGTEKNQFANKQLQPQRKSGAHLWVFLLVALLSLSITLVDSIKTGSTHYGSIKVQYMCSLVLIVTLLPLAIAKTTVSELPFSGFLIAATCSVLLLFALSSDAIFTNLTLKLRSQQWVENQIWSKETNWQAYVTHLSLTDRKIADSPIGCVEQVVGKRYWHTTTGTYVCTRHLLALSGLERESGPLVIWQLRSDWKSSLDNLRNMSESIKSRNLLVLSSEGNVVDIKRVDSYFLNPEFPE
jgi:hypothetical protein